MDAQPPRGSKVNDTKILHSAFKDAGDGDEYDLTLESVGLSYEKMPLNLGSSVRRWLHRKLEGLVIGEETPSDLQIN